MAFAERKIEDTEIGRTVELLGGRRTCGRTSARKTLLASH